MSPDETIPSDSDSQDVHQHDQAHEPDDLRVGRVFAVGLALCGVVVGAALLMRGLNHLYAKWNRVPSNRSPVEPQPVAESLPFVPDQSVLLAKLRAEEERTLTTYGWANRKDEIVRIPIARAIDLIGARKELGTLFPSKTAEPGRNKPMPDQPQGHSR